MKNNRIYPVVQVMLAAALFGASAPVSKIFLEEIAPVTMSAFLYLGSAAGLLLFLVIQMITSPGAHRTEAKLGRADIPWLAGAILTGGVVAPIALMFGLRATPAATASLMLNFEVAATTLIAVLVFREHLGKYAGWAVVLITLASIILSWDIGADWHVSIGALGVLVACVGWGLDNNFTRHISAKDPVSIGIIKGTVAGLISLCLALALDMQIPGLRVCLGIMMLGAFGYGFSVMFFILALRGLGAARTGALFGTAPFAGVLISFIIWRESPNTLFIIAFPIMVGGVLLLLKESHFHLHNHSEMLHDHKHCHDDEHHLHEHPAECRETDTAHSHLHNHPETEHEGHHTPDDHHRHEH